MRKAALPTSLLIAALLAPGSAMAAPRTDDFRARISILKPLVLTKIADLDFGEIIPGIAVGEVTIDADTGARTATDPAMIALPDDGERGAFGSAGQDTASVDVDLVYPTELLSADNKVIEVVEMVLDQGNVRNRVLSNSSAIFFVGIGGTIRIRPDQEERFYTGTATLTVQYN